MIRRMDGRTDGRIMVMMRRGGEEERERRVNHWRRMNDLFIFERGGAFDYTVDSVPTCLDVLAAKFTLYATLNLTIPCLPVGQPPYPIPPTTHNIPPPTSRWPSRLYSTGRTSCTKTVLLIAARMFFILSDPFQRALHFTVSEASKSCAHCRGSR